MIVKDTTSIPLAIQEAKNEDDVKLIRNEIERRFQNDVIGYYAYESLSRKLYFKEIYLKQRRL